MQIYLFNEIYIQSDIAENSINSFLQKLTRLIFLNKWYNE